MADYENEENSYLHRKFGREGGPPVVKTLLSQSWPAINSSNK